MRQILQSINNGETELADVPCPQVKPGCLLIQSRASVVSIGTERMVVEFGKASLLNKVKQQPEKIKQVIEKIKTDGLLETIDTVKAKMDQLIPLGYSNAGVVLKIGKGVTGFAVGDRVVSNGPHAEVVCAPQNLCAKIPEPVSDEAAAFTIISAISLQGVRLIQPTLGERIAVIGLGLTGLLAVQILKAHGCRVLGIDFNEAKIKLAEEFGAETVNLSTGGDPVAAGLDFSGGHGMDGVLITAATKSNEPVHQAAQMCRKRGRIVLTGVTGLELLRNDFYKKELTFQVSCSYGPGRYEPNYEDKGMDYPIEYVRWTEQRNLETVLEMMADARLQTLPLVTHRFQFDRALDAYQLICKSQTPLGMLLQYPEREQKDSEISKPTITLKNSAVSAKSTLNPTIAMIGAGGFTTKMLLPALKRTGVRLKTIASLGGLSGMYAGRKFGFEVATTDIDPIFNDREVDLIFISTRHESHAALVCKALKAGKHVFVEKPLALNREQLTQITAVYQEKEADCKIMVGFNRRFSPHVTKIKSLLKTTDAPKSIIITVNAGAIAASHWTQDLTIGGGRVVGEGCHFIDLLRFLVGYPITEIQVATLKQKSAPDCPDNLSFTMGFQDGSLGTVHYLANGHKSLPKERLEIFCAGKVLQLNNFKTLTGFGWPLFKQMPLWRQDKGHFQELAAFIKAVRSGEPSPIPFNELVEVTQASFTIMDLIASER